MFKNFDITEWFSWRTEEMECLKVSKRHFINIPRHIQFGNWKTIAVTPCIDYSIAKIFDFKIENLWWKDKWKTPRYEYPPVIMLTLFHKWCLLIWWGFIGKEYDDDEYWEQVLWTEFYNKGDVEKAREKWGWRGIDGKSTWKEKYLKDEYRTTD